MLWVDFDARVLLGTKSIPLWTPKARRLQCSNPTLIHKFNIARNQHHKKNNMEEKRKHIEELLTSQVPVEEWGHLFEELDQLRVEGILLAERQCRRLKMGRVPWTPQLQASMLKIGYYQRCRLKYCLGKAINSRTLHKWYMRSKCIKPVHTGEEAIARLKEEFKIYNSIKNKAQEKR
jgi:hypothetical protein